jgi:tetratricopeptide (TPR) repeat protein
MLKKMLVLLAICCHACSLFSQESKVFLEEGWEAFRKGDYESTVQFAKTGIAYRDKFLFNHYYMKGFALAMQRKYKEAETAFDIALKIDENNSEYNWVKGQTHWNLGRVYGNLERFDEEITAYKTALQYIDDPNLYNNLGFAYVKMDSLETGLTYLTKTLELDKNNSYAFNNRAWLLLKLKRYELAKKDLDKSKELDENNPYLYRNYALYYIGIEDLDEACLNLKKAQKLKYRDFADEDEKMDVVNLIKEHCLELGIKQ